MVREEIARIKEVEQEAVLLVRRSDEQAEEMIRAAEQKRDEILAGAEKSATTDLELLKEGELRKARTDGEALLSEARRAAADLQSRTEKEITEASLLIVRAVTGEGDVLSRGNETGRHRLS